MQVTSFGILGAIRIKVLTDCKIYRVLDGNVNFLWAGIWARVEREIMTGRRMIV